MEEIQEFKKSMDAWVKYFNAKTEPVEFLIKIADEQAGCINHNYELICELRAEINRLKEEVAALRLIQLMHLQTQVRR